MPIVLLLRARNRKLFVGSRRDEMNNDVRHGQTDGIFPSEAVQDSIRSPTERVRMEKEDTRNE